MALTVEQRDLVDLIRQALARNDRVFAKFWQEVNAVFLHEPAGPLTSFRRKLIQRDIDRIIGRYYGSTVEGALSSTLFKEMLQNTDSAAALPFQRSIESVKEVIDKRDPMFWGQKIASKASPTSTDGFLKVVGELNGRVTQEQRLLRSRKLDVQRRWVPRESWNTKTGYRLSDRIWLQGRQLRKAIDARIREGIRNGEDALTVARDVEKYLNPAFKSETVTKAGKVIRRNQTAFPGRGGVGNFPARRLIITETSRIHAAATMEAARVTPGVKGMKWLLSANHDGVIDQCDDNARNHSQGMDAGEYTFDEFPLMPSHPMCRCCSAPAQVSRQQMIDDLIAKYSD